MISDYPLITLGSPMGIGYEIFLIVVKNNFFSKPPFCVGSKTVLNYFTNLLGISTNFKVINSDIVKSTIVKETKNFDFYMIDVDDKEFVIDDILKISKEIDGMIAYRSIREAGLLVKNGLFKSITTLPVTKENINLIDKDFYGHTEFFQKLWDEKNVFMTFVSSKINLLLLTTHIPLKDVPKTITKESIQSGIDMALALREKLALKKKICLLGLNPHAGENGLLGDEEFKFKEILSNYSNDLIEGPIPSDTAFIPTNLQRYSIIIAAYHDQGLIPFKMLAFEDGVNLSFGMRYIRTSVDHGTGISLIGKKLANTKSFENAYNLACKLTAI